MSVLSTEQIRRRLGNGGQDQLIIAPILEPLEQLKGGQASIDVRIGSQFTLAATTLEGVIDTVRWPNRPLQTKKLFIPFGGHIVLHPHQFLLGETLEFVRLPCDLMAYVVGRSSWGREGLVVATAVGVQPGYSGSITLELRNLGEVPMCIYPGDPVAQLFIHKVARGKTTAAPAVSQFAGAGGPRHGRHRYPGTQQKLERAQRKLQTVADAEDQRERKSAGLSSALDHR